MINIANKADRGSIISRAIDAAFELQRSSTGRLPTRRRSAATQWRRRLCRNGMRTEFNYRRVARIYEPWIRYVCLTLMIILKLFCCLTSPPSSCASVGRTPRFGLRFRPLVSLVVCVSRLCVCVLLTLRHTGKNQSEPKKTSRVKHNFKPFFYPVLVSNTDARNFDGASATRYCR